MMQLYLSTEMFSVVLERCMGGGVYIDLCSKSKKSTSYVFSWKFITKLMKMYQQYPFTLKKKTETYNSNEGKFLNP